MSDKPYPGYADVEKRQEYMRKYRKQWLKTEAGKRWKEAYEERRKVLVKKRYEQPVEKAKKKVRSRQNHLKRQYGITEIEYNNMFAIQSGCCAICKTHQSDLKTKLHVDHNHSTGKIRGLLCSMCNKGIGALKDSAEILLAAAKYLEDKNGE